LTSEIRVYKISDNNSIFFNSIMDTNESSVVPAPSVEITKKESKRNWVPIVIVIIVVAACCCLSISISAFIFYRNNYTEFDGLVIPDSTDPQTGSGAGNGSGNGSSSGSLDNSSAAELDFDPVDTTMSDATYIENAGKFYSKTETFKANHRLIQGFKSQSIIMLDLTTDPFANSVAKNAGYLQINGGDLYNINIFHSLDVESGHTVCSNFIEEGLGTDYFGQSFEVTNFDLTAFEYSSRVDFNKGQDIVSILGCKSDGRGGVWLIEMFAWKGTKVGDMSFETYSTKVLNSFDHVTK
jgi:hypothetical protein